MDVSSHGTEAMELKQLFVTHAPFAWRVLRRFGVAESDLPDACQDAFIVVHRKLGEFEGRSSVRTWLYRICARVASDYRKRAHRRYETEPLIHEPAVGDDALRTAELAQLCALLERTLEGLDDDKRQVFVLYELEELPMAQIAELLGCPIKTAFSRLYVARERVNAALRRAGCAAWLIPLDPRPMREVAQAPIARALESTWDVTPDAAQLSAHWHMLTPKLAVTSASTSFAVSSYVTGALAVVTAFTLTLANTARPVATIAPKAPGHAAHVPTAMAPREPNAHAPAPAAELHGSDEVALTPVAPVSVPSARTPARAPARAPKRRAPRGLHAVEITPPHVEEAALSPWIEAPAITQPTATATAIAPSSGLDEVLAATSIRPLMRVGPASRSAELWALLPNAPRTKQP